MQRRHVERRVAPMVGETDGCPKLEQGFRRRPCVFVYGRIHRRVAATIDGVEICAERNQAFDNLDIERVFRRLDTLGTGGKRQHLAYGRISGRRPVQRGLAFLVSRVRIRPGLEQTLDDKEVAVSGCVVKGGPAAIVAGIDLHAALDQALNLTEVTERGGVNDVCGACEETDKSPLLSRCESMARVQAQRLLLSCRQRRRVRAQPEQRAAGLPPEFLASPIG